MNQKGFTLLELIISITLVALIVTISLGGLRLSFSSVDKAEQKTEYLERIRSSLFIINTQLQSLAYVLKQEDNERVNYLKGDSQHLEFVSNTSFLDRYGGFVLVSYTVRQDSQGKYELYASEKLINHDEGVTVLLLKGLDRIYFQYQYGAETEEQIAWHDEFKEKTGTPFSIKVTLVEGTRSYSLEIPVRSFRKTEVIR